MECFCTKPRAVTCKIVLLDEQELVHEIQVSCVHIDAFACVFIKNTKVTMARGHYAAIMRLCVLCFFTRLPAAVVFNLSKGTSSVRNEPRRFSKKRKTFFFSLHGA